MTRFSFVFGGSYGSALVDNSIRTVPAIQVAFNIFKNDILVYIDYLPLGIRISSSNELWDNINQNADAIKYIPNTTGFIYESNASLDSYTLFRTTMAKNGKLLEFIVTNSSNNDLKSCVIKVETNSKVDSMLNLKCFCVSGTVRLKNFPVDHSVLEEFNDGSLYMFYSLANSHEGTMIFAEKRLKLQSLLSFYRN